MGHTQRLSGEGQQVRGEWDAIGQDTQWLGPVLLCGRGWAALGLVVHHNASNGDGLRHQNGVIADHGAGLYGVFSDAQLGLVGFFNHRIQGDGAYVAVGQGDHEGIDRWITLQHYYFRLTLLQSNRSITVQCMTYTVKRLEGFSDWLKGLKDGLARQRLIKRLRKVQLGNFGDVQPVGEGVFEMREHFGPGWRMYYVQRGSFLIVMLGGGDKSTQQSDIRRAIELAKSLED
ncbi:type II toxin-antitoxin system RelE/ParE family toxin [Xylella fastidiosa subsp. multiplex]|nr:type II toxin-antitoxin system RelE/ParE family toxin [Xylella fastidiosa]MDD0892844.1 type II toxin-antitoxin system RelE/ParE family toxin [Xylella fastidiosa subsp. multiplex]MDD0959607.1 type II toxin-antitoxin system RelE/ParE family toxin [Xylella fastidiosa subsp. multiplex]